MTRHATAITVDLYFAGTWQGSSAYFVPRTCVHTPPASRRFARLMRLLGWS